MATFASDSFTGGTGQSLQTFNTDFVKHTIHAARADIIVGDIIRSTESSDVIYYHVADPPSDTYSCSLDIIRNTTTSTGKTAGPAVRQSITEDTSYLAAYSTTSNTIVLVRRNAGVATSLGSAAVTITTTPYDIRVHAETIDAGTVRVKVFHGLTELITADDISADRITATGKAAIRFTGNSTSSQHLHADNFLAESAVVAPVITLNDTTVSVASTSGGSPPTQALLFDGASVTAGGDISATLVIADPTKADLTGSLPAGWSGSAGSYSRTAASAETVTADIVSLTILGAQVGSTTATLTIDDGTNTDAEVVTVNVVEADLSVEVDNGGFYMLVDVEVGSTVSTQFKLFNVGNASLVLGTLSISGNNYSISESDNPSGQTVPAGDFATVTVVYAPDSDTEHEGMLFIPSNDADSPYGIIIIGNGVMPAEGVVFFIDGNTQKTSVRVSNSVRILKSESLDTSNLTNRFDEVKYYGKQL